MRRSILVLALAAAFWGLLAAIGTGAAFAVTPFKDIASAGPLEHVYLGDELSCQIDHTSDVLLQFFPPDTIPGDCGTFVAVGPTLYAPDFVNHGSTATAALGVYVPFTPVSQTNVTGTGTAADPFRVVTVSDLGLSGLRIQQTDTYVAGDEAYRTDIVVSNASTLAQSGILYRAGDCFLGGSDIGFGFIETLGDRKAVGCSVNANNTPASRIEEWVPLTGGNNFFHGSFSAVWSRIATKTAFPDTCQCTTLQDNGAGISWSFTVPAAGSLTFSHITTFSPTGKQALETSKTPDSPTSTAGGTNGYTITIANPNPESVTLDSIVDTLPAGFTYAANSTSGITTANPTINGQTLTWAGPLAVPGNGSVALSFDVTVSSTPGDYFNQAGGEAAGGYTVLSTGPTAKITVTALSADVSIVKSDAPDPVTVGEQLVYTLLVSNGGLDAATGVTVTDVLSPSVSFLSVTTTQGSCTGGTTVSCSLGGLANGASATITITVATTAEGTISNTATVLATTADPDTTNNVDTEVTNVFAPTADLSIVKSDSPDPVTVGQQLVYTLLVSNGGPNAAAGVTVTDVLPATVNFFSVATTQGSCAGGATVSCTLGGLANSASATITITVATTTDADLSNTATVSATTADPNAANNTDTESTQVDAPAGPMCNGLPATFVGGPGRDYFQGGPGVDVVVDPGGKNYLQTGGGDDHVCLGGGNDEIDTGDGNDFIDAGGGNNKVKTGNGNDTVVSGTGDDDIDTGNGEDTVTDAGGRNKISTGKEADSVTAGSGNDEIDTGDGDDVVAAGDGSNEVKAGNGNDAITAGAGDDKIDGGNGFDVCSPGAGVNEVKDCEG